MQKYIGTAIKKDVNNPGPAGETPAVNVDVRVVVTATGAPANIYSDNGSTIIDQNTYKTDANGNHEFYAANGRYTVRYLLASGTIEYTDIVLEDPTDRKAIESEALNGTNNSKFMTPLRTHESFNQFGLGSSGDANLASVTTKDLNGGFYSGFGGANPSASLDNPFPSNGGAFSMINSSGVNPTPGSYSFSLASVNTSNPVVSELKYRVSADGTYTQWLRVYTESIFDHCQNLSGSTIASNSTVAGSSLSPSKIGTWRNVSGGDILNNGYGLFKKD